MSFLEVEAEEVDEFFLSLTHNQCWHYIFFIYKDVVLVVNITVFHRLFEDDSRFNRISPGFANTGSQLRILDVVS